MFFKKIIKSLNQYITDQSWYSQAHHPFFGEVGYYGFKDERMGYWESEIDVDGLVVSVIINSAIEELPTDIHQSFVESIINNLDSTIAAVKPLMLNTLSEWVKFDRDEDWHRLFRLSGIEVPIDADVRNDWEISFECLVDKVGHHFTCYFKNGNPEFISVDG
ncbi:MAG: hypothetical protein R3E90_09775 [Marinicella sp.]|nr:hypothetical protein [Xanthomonadales bacterium]